MLDTVLARLDEIEQAREAAQRIDPTATALQFLQCVYRNDAIPLSVRIRAAVEAAPFESPKLSAAAIIPGGEEFAAKLKKAIGRSRERQKQIEHAGANRSRLPGLNICTFLDLQSSTLNRHLVIGLTTLHSETNGAGNPHAEIVSNSSLNAREAIYELDD